QLSNTRWWSGVSCWMTKTVLSPPLEVYTRRLSASYAESSGPGPIGTELITRPPFESIITMRRFAHPMKSRPFFWSTAMVRGPTPGATGLTRGHLAGIDLQDDVFLHQIDKNIALCIRAYEFRSFSQVEGTDHLAFFGVDNSCVVAVQIEGKNTLRRCIKDGWPWVLTR